MIPEARLAMAAAWPRRGEPGGAADSGSTIPRGAGPARDRERGRARLSPPGPGSGLGSGSGPGSPAPSARPPWGSRSSVLLPVLHAFTAAWERGESPVAEHYLGRLDPTDVQGAVDLIYREFCLAESAGLAPDAESYVARFPGYGEDLRRLFRFHGACSPSLLDRLLGPAAESGSESGPAGGFGPALPEVGDSIGPYLLRRELGRGSFARVFLAEQADLANRLVVLKIAARSTREPWLLARARHAHIVEIVSHSLVDDGAFQLICMPFWGGATLADVLEAPAGPAAGEAGRRRGRLRVRGRGPATGADLLAALDAVAAPEYPSVRPTRPAREILAPLTYDRAIAWVIARLAEALDHAACLGVTHGDVKPSNILLSADGNPMLLDFNLARDDAPIVDATGRPIDPGGTLAYMAPERLRALALACQAADSGEWDGGDRSSGAVGLALPAGQAAHVADIYSLGTVLLEAMSGRPPFPIPPLASPAADPPSRPARLMSTAGAYAAARARPARAIVRDFEVASGRSIAPALGSILERCLDPDPRRRYGRALELAEDLDRWRTDRPLAYAAEPFWRQAVPRWFRARRRMLAVVALWLLGVGLLGTALVLVGADRLHRRGLQALAVRTLAQWDDPDSGAFLRSQRLNAGSRSWEPDDRGAFEVARRALIDYRLLGPDDAPAAGDWRLGDGIRYLPPDDRADLEAWLLERAYRFCRTSADRNGSSADRRRARDLLDRAAAGRSIRAFAPLRARLAAGLESAIDPPATLPAPAWLDEHLLGFAAECESESASASVSASASASPAGRGPDPRRTIERALRHYEAELTIRPDSFWGHYRAAAALFGLHRPGAAADHLGQCLDRRPGNATVQAQLAGCLIAKERYAQAMEVCDRALESAPRYAELYFTRAFARAASRQTGGFRDDMRRYDMLRGVLPRSYWDADDSATAIRGATAIDSVLSFAAAHDVRAGAARRPGREESVRIDPEELEARATLAMILTRAELFPLAGVEAEKVLIIQPDHIPARLLKVEEAIAARRFDAAMADLEAILEDLELEEYVRGPGGSLDHFLDITRLYLEAGRVHDARTVAEQTRDLAIRLGRDHGKAHFNLARVYAVLGASEFDLVAESARQLFRAFVANPGFREWYREQGRWFGPVRSQIDAAMGRMADPEVVRARHVARLSAGAAPRAPGR